MTVVHLRDVVADLVDDLDINEADAENLVWSLVDSQRPEGESDLSQESVDDLLHEIDS